MGMHGFRGLLGLALLVLGVSQASAGAFALREGSAAAQGASLAGRSSGGRDVSFSLANPAALRNVVRGEVSQGLAAILVDSRAEQAATVTGFRRDANPGQLGLVPALAAGWRVSPTVVLGLAVDSPFGLATRYPDDFAGSFDAVESELLTLAVTPMVSWQVSPWLTLGGGVSVQYADARLSNRTLGGISSVSGDDVGFGFTLGVLLDPVAGTTVGARLRSGVRHKLTGRFSDNYILAPGVQFEGAGDATFRLPTIANLGVTQAIRDDLRIMAEVEFANWRVYDEVVITESATGRRIVDPQNYRNSWLVALGGEWDANDRLTLRTGLAYDQTPVRSASRNLRVPDTDKVWLSTGLSFALTDRIGIDAAYTLLLSTEAATLRLRVGPDAGTPVRVRTTAHELGVNLRFNF